MPPLIGLTTDFRDLTSSAGVGPGHVLNMAYTSAVLRAGGIPVLLAPVPPEAAPQVAAAVDGLVLTGGGDVEPHAYGGTLHDSMYRMDAGRDAFEIALAREARRTRLPTLAICRGLQVLNVAFGGTLIEDIPSQQGTDVAHALTGEHVFERHQPVHVSTGSRLGVALADDNPKVNSIHHQAVRDVAPGCRAVAWAEDGIIEGIEHEDVDWPMWAVQWHPEYLAERDDTALKLFAALVAAAS